jgi:hypothetical protein
LHPDTRICSPSKFCTGIQKWLRAKLYRDRCAAAFGLNPLPGFDSARPKHCTAIAPSAEDNLYPDMQKPRRASLITAPVALSSLPGYMSPLPFDSATFTNTNRRAVRLQTSWVPKDCKQYLTHRFLDNFLGILTGSKA